MFDISALKNMKLSELQDIAKLAKTIKFAGVKKEDLIVQILEQQVASSTDSNTSVEAGAEKPKRARILPSKKESTQATQDTEEVSNTTSNGAEIVSEASQSEAPKIVKFSKSAYEQKVAKKEKVATKDNQGELELPLESMTKEVVEAPTVAKKANPNQLNKQNPNQNQNGNQNQNPNQNLS